MRVSSPEQISIAKLSNSVTKFKEHIDYQRPSFEQIGISDRFKLSNAIDNISFSDPILLVGISSEEEEYFLQALKVTSPYSANKDTNGYSLIMYQIRGDEIKPVGHVDFREYKKRGLKDFQTSVSILERTHFKNTLVRLPSGIKAVAEQFWTDPAAVIVDETFRDKKLGGLLWSVACGWIETQGAKYIQIVGDNTVGRVNYGQGFYDRYGLQKYSYPTQGYTRKIDVEKKLAYSHLSPQQEVKVAKAFGRDLLKKQK